ncbi:unnamed protein product, partial [Musa textilis]
MTAEAEKLEVLLVLWPRALVLLMLHVDSTRLLIYIGESQNLLKHTV